MPAKTQKGNIQKNLQSIQKQLKKDISFVCLLRKLQRKIKGGFFFLLLFDSLCLFPWIPLHKISKTQYM